MLSVFSSNLSKPLKSCRILSNPVKSYLIHSNPVKSCQILSITIESYRISTPFQSVQSFHINVKWFQSCQVYPVIFCSLLFFFYSFFSAQPFETGFSSLVLYCVIKINHRWQKVDIGQFRPYLKTFTLNSFTLHTHCLVRGIAASDRRKCPPYYFL